MKTTKQLTKKTLFVFKNMSANVQHDETSNIMRTITTISIRPTTL